MKHLFSDNDSPQNSGVSWDSTGSSTRLPHSGEDRHNIESFQREVFQPAWQSLADAAAALMLEWLSGGLGLVGQLAQWINQQQRAKKNYNPYQERLNQPVKQTQMLSLESQLALRKAYSGLGNSGDSAVDNRDYGNTAGDTSSSSPVLKTNPWLEATKRQTCTLPMPRPVATKPSKPAKQRKKFIMDEPNRGLDDIYTSPVNGFFVEEGKTTTRKKPAPQWKKSVAPIMNTQIAAAMIDAELGKTAPDSNSKQANPKRTGSKQFRSEQETFEQLQAALYESQAGKTNHEPHEAEFIPGFKQSEAESNPALADGYPAGMFAAEEQINPEAKTIQPNPGPSRLLARVRATNLDFKRQMPVYQEMKVEMSAADHMVRNNRILHNSISNLADSYFKKAAEEEQASKS